MPTPIFIPRINNNDDVVKLTRLLVEPGAAIRKADILAEIETDKANFEIEAEADGFVLRIDRALGEMCEVGCTLMWVGASKDDEVPEETAAGMAAEASRSSDHSPTLKALLLLTRYSLDERMVPASGDRLSAHDVESYVRARGIGPAHPPSASKAAPEDRPSEPGKSQAMTPQERGMSRTVTWHRDQAVSGYMELPYDPTEWDQAAGLFQKQQGLIMSPLLSLMAWQVSRLAMKYPKLNATISQGELYLYDHVNVGFMIQSGEHLVMPVLREAQTMDARSFVEALGSLQRQAMKLQLKTEQVSGATIAFTSMSRWGVSRHVPILPPYTSMIVAHSTPVSNQAFLGASYDHRVLTGFDVARALREIAKPPTI